MNILMTSDTYLPRLGGGEYHVYYMMQELRALHQCITLVTTEPMQGHRDGKEQGVVRLQYKNFLSLPMLFRKIWKYSETADVIHSHYSYRLGFIAGLVAFLRRKPFVITQHGLGLLPQPGSTPLISVIFRIWRFWSMFFAGALISTSHDLSTEIQALGFAKKIIHIPNGYDPAIFRPLPPTTNSFPSLLAVRRLTPKNGIQYLIAAVAELHSAFPDLRCTIIGDGILRSDLEALARQLGVLSFINFLGAQDHQHLIREYAKAHIVIIPSTAESTSLACIEAMALQKVIVASRVGGLIELIGNNEERGYLASITKSEHCDYDAPMMLPKERLHNLVASIHDALRHPEISGQKAALASAYVKQNFTWPFLARRTLEEVYEPRCT